MFRRLFDRIKSLFGYTITLNRVRDRITIKEGNESLVLAVDCDSTAIVTRIRNAQESIIKVSNGKSTEEERNQAARQFSEAIFGKEQTDRLSAFYNDDLSCVVTICGMYFEKRLCKKITAAQKSLK